MPMTERSRLLAYARARRAALHWVDRYQPKGAPYPAVCRSCGATEWQGRWRWDDVPPGLPPVLCPACERVRDGAAAHRVVLTGALPPHWPAVRELIAKVERAEVQADPLQRVLRIDIGDDRVEVPTTGLRIARQLVAAILRRWRHGCACSSTRSAPRSSGCRSARRPAHRPDSGAERGGVPVERAGAPWPRPGRSLSCSPRGPYHGPFPPR